MDWLTVDQGEHGAALADRAGALGEEVAVPSVRTANLPTSMDSVSPSGWFS